MSSIPVRLGAGQYETRIQKCRSEEQRMCESMLYNVGSKKMMMFNSSLVSPNDERIDVFCKLIFVELSQRSEPMVMSEMLLAKLMKRFTPSQWRSSSFTMWMNFKTCIVDFHWIPEYDS